MFLSFQKVIKAGFILNFTFFCLLFFSTQVSAIVYEPVPEVKFPDNNPWSKEKEELGEKLFFDPILSRDNSVSCSTCHKPEKFYTDGLPQSVGISRQPLKRNSPTIFNSAFQKTLFWDGRAGSLEEQVLMPIQDKNEMDQDLKNLVRELISKAEYRKLFEEAFGSSGITPERLAMAIAPFERTLVTGDTSYDRFWQGDKKAMSPSALRGMDLFSGKAKCSICHSGPLFTDQQFHNIGLSISGSKHDKGRKNVTGEIFHEGAFKTPGLRGISLSGPYMHDGSLPSLKLVIEFYDQGGVASQRKSPFISPIGLSDNEKEDLLQFLMSLGIENENYKATVRK